MDSCDIFLLLQPVTDVAHAELLEMLRQHLPVAFPARFRAEGYVLHNLVTGESI